MEIISMQYGRGKCVGQMNRVGGRPRTIRCVLLGCVCATALLSGCGGDRGPARVVVSGSVSYNGKPISEGIIRFVPDKSASKPTMATVIKDGKYNADGLGGVPTGTHKVQIEAMRRIGNEPSGNSSSLHAGGNLQQFIPKKYNAISQLEITVPSGSGKITKDFELTN
jgi:hypothetical protein